MAELDSFTRLVEWRRQKDEFLSGHRASPLYGDTSFEGLTYYPENPDVRVLALVERALGSEPVTLITSTGDERQYLDYGVARFELGGEDQALKLFATVDEPEKLRLFLPFTDATSGSETYGGGRYLDLHVAPGAPAELLLDFNYAYHPYCAYTEGYSCAFPPPGNRLNVPVRAGERLPEGEEQ